MWSTFNRFLTIFEAFVTHFYLCCTHCIVSKSLLNHVNSFSRGMFKLNTKVDADSLFYSLNHLECSSDTVHMLTQLNLLPTLTSTVKSSSFTHAHSSPLSLLPGYIDVAQTILITLIMAGHFPNRPHIHNLSLYIFLFIGMKVYIFKIYFHWKTLFQKYVIFTN